MKPFDLEAAKKGAPVCTRDGGNARIVCFDRKDDEFPIVDGETEDFYSFTSEGCYHTNSKDELDLMMQSVKKEGWINIYNNNESGSIIYDSKDDALKSAVSECVATIKIEWEV
jgi:hypothetical protein